MQTVRSLWSRRHKQVPYDMRCEACRDQTEFHDFMQRSNLIYELGKLEDVFKRADCPMCKAVLRRFSHDLELHVVDVAAGTGMIDLGLKDATTYSALNHGGLQIRHKDCMKGTISQWSGGKPPSQHVENGLIDVGQVSKWLLKCQTRHGTACGWDTIQDTPNTTDLILIDVLDKRLITTPSICPYLALSYVWGGVHSLQTTLANFAQLSRKGALQDHDMLPQVVEDAMRLVRALGQRYLWVDALCIIQDDFARKPIMLAQMDQVYSQAFLTIVAMAGSDATRGLPGLRMDSRSPIWTITRPYHKVDIICRPPPLTELLKASWYDTRAWTFQERLLSKRCLYLSDQQMYFQCQDEIVQEDGIDDFRGSLHANPLQSILAPRQNQAPSRLAWVDHFDIYILLVKLYTKRRLTYQSDILNAFRGITTVITRRCGGIFAAGLPEAVFDAALLWRHDYLRTSKRREPSESDTLDIPSHHPSWCWSGWVGQASFLFEHSAETATDGAYRGYYILGLEFEGGKIPLKPMVRSFRLAVDGNIRTIERQTGLFESVDNADGTHEEDVIDECSPLRHNVLLFWAFAVGYYSFGVTNNTKIIDLNGRQCGLIFTSVPPFLEDTPREFILLSLMKEPVAGVLVSSEWDFIHDFYYKDTLGPCEEENESVVQWCLAVVLLIGWKDGYAERLGIGVIRVDAWELAHPVAKFIRLA